MLTRCVESYTSHPACKLTQLSSPVLGELYVGLVLLLEEVLRAVSPRGEDLLSGN